MYNFYAKGLLIHLACLFFAFTATVYYFLIASAHFTLFPLPNPLPGYPTTPFRPQNNAQCFTGQHVHPSIQNFGQTSRILTEHHIHQTFMISATPPPSYLLLLYQMSPKQKACRGVRGFLNPS